MEKSVIPKSMQRNHYRVVKTIKFPVPKGINRGIVQLQGIRTDDEFLMNDIFNKKQANALFTFLVEHLPHGIFKELTNLMKEWDEK